MKRKLARFDDLLEWEISKQRVKHKPHVSELGNGVERVALF